MTFPCCRCALKVGCRILGSVDIFLSILSFFQWTNMFMESTQLRGDNWDSFLHSPGSQRTSIVSKCGPQYFQLYKPTDLGNKLTEVTVLFSLSSLGYLINGLFVVYATISAPDTGKIILTVFTSCQLILMTLSLSGAILFQDPMLCFYGWNGMPGHKNRQLVFLILTLLFIFVYKVYELFVIGHYIRQVGRVAPHEDPENFKICPATIRAAMLLTPKHSKTNILLEPDLNMNYISNGPTVVANSKKPDDMNSNTPNETHINEVIDPNQNDVHPNEIPLLGISGFYSPHACRTEY